MRHILVSVLVWALAVAAAVKSSVAEGDRLLVLDGVKPHGAFSSRILLVDAQSGAILAERHAGTQAIMGLSPERDVVGVISLESVAGRAHRCRADFYRANDLAPLESGYLPIEPTPRQTSGGFLYFAPDGKGFIVQQMASYPDDTQPRSECWLYHVQRILDDQGVFKLAGEGIKVPQCISVTMLRVVDWPRAVAWRGGSPGIFSIDFDAKEAKGQLGFYDDSSLVPLDPALFGQQVVDAPVRRRLPFGTVHTFDGRTGYYVPQHPWGNPPRMPAGYLRKIDLTVDPPKLVIKSQEPVDQLRAATAAVTPRALFVVRENIEGSRIKPSNSIRAFDATDVTLLNEFQTSVADIQQLVPNSDGTHLYALSPSEAKIAIIDAQTGKEIKVLERVGDFPVMILLLPGRGGD